LVRLADVIKPREYVCPLCPPGTVHSTTVAARTPDSCPEHRAEWRRRQNTALKRRKGRLAAGLDPDYEGSYQTWPVDPMLARAVRVLANTRDAQALAGFAFVAAGLMTTEQHRAVYRWLADALEDLTATHSPSPHPLARPEGKPPP